MKTLRTGILILGLSGLALFTTKCGSKGGGSSSSSSSTSATSSSIALTGTLSIASTSLGLTGPSLELATNGVIKCTYATETEDKSDVDASGNFTLSCNKNTAMVISYFDADGNPTCSIIFRVDKKDTETAVLDQDIDMKKITCADGSASVDLDTLAPNVAKAQTFKQDASVTLINGAEDHWAFKIEKQAMIGVDGKAASSSSASGSTAKSRKKASLASETSKSAGAAGGSEVGKTVNMAFMDETCDGGTVKEGVITVQHQEEEGEGGGTWECIDGATITWTGKSFSISLTEEKDVALDMAKREINNQRPQEEEVNFQQVGSDGKPAEIARDPAKVSLVGLELADPSFAAPDTILAGMTFPLEAYCGNTTKWNKSGSSIVDTETFGTPCTNFLNFKFVDFGKFCSKLSDTAADSNSLARSNVMQCVPQGGTFTASTANKNDPQCAENYKDFDGHNPVEDMGRGVGDLRQRFALIVKLNDIAIAGTDAEAAKFKAFLAEAVSNLKDALKKVTDQMSVMEAAVAQIKANRVKRCTATTVTPQDQSADREQYAKMDGRSLQPLFNNFQQLFNKYVMQNPPVNELFRRFIMAPAYGFDGTACTIPEGADTVFSHTFLKPTGECKFTSNITLAGVFKDASTINPMSVTFMDKPNGDCNMAIQHIKFDSTTGCWVWDGTKPKLESESVDKSGMFKGDLIQRMKLMGTATLTDD